MEQRGKHEAPQSSPHLAGSGPLSPILSNCIRMMHIISQHSRTMVAEAQGMTEQFFPVLCSFRKGIRT